MSSPTEGARRTRGGRPVLSLYGALSAVLLIAALVMALIVRPPPPPAIAELGPSPQEQIEDAREDQAAGSGKAALATSSDEDEKEVQPSTKQVVRSTTTNGLATTSSPPEVSATRRCFGDPPRQTEDPHSPPCVFEIFEGDNGGETAPGVTSTEVRIIVDSEVSAHSENYIKALLAHFNNRYEFYGRRLALAAPPSSRMAPGSRWNPSEAKAAANEDIAHNPFVAVTDLFSPSNFAYHDRLAEENIHSVLTQAPLFGFELVRDGWLWTTMPGLDSRGVAAGSFICQALAAQRARHAGQDVIKDRYRRFAIVNGKPPDVSQWPSIDSLRVKLEQCGADYESFEYDTNAEGRQSVIQQLVSGDYTTIVLVGYGSDFLGLERQATLNRFYPEWFGFGQWREGLEANWAMADDRQSSSAFGITQKIRVRKNAEIPACWASEEEGSSCGGDGLTGAIEALYKSLLVVASGVQGVGPSLTPESFRRALWNMVWPNPNAGKSPYWQQRVSFSLEDPVFYDDYAVWWWNKNLPSQQENSGGDGGSFCYLDSGGRFVGQFPADADRRLFNMSADQCR